MGLKSKIRLQLISNLKMVPRGLFFATNSKCGNSSVEFQVVLENAKFTIKDSILTRVNEEGTKERMVEDAKIPGSKFYYGASHAKANQSILYLYLKNTCDYVHVKDALPSIANN